ncbi:MAG TPA: hypothetical protein VM097_00520 [Mycobacteriales bacterium]|nr:hypothetical protein [Mycobacteriales bacterium]
MRRLLAGTALLAAAACATPLTSARVEESFSRVFGGLYALQQEQDGRARLDADLLHVRAACKRTGPDPSGPGEDWSCTVDYVDSRTPFTQVFELLVKPDGCWRAEAPPVAQPALRTDPLTGATRPNPLAEFDGCFDTSWR